MIGMRTANHGTYADATLASPSGSVTTQGVSDAR
jgi:hypothetical protein